MNNIVTWFLMLLYGIPGTTLLILDACQGFIRTKKDPVGLLFIFGFCYAVVLFGVWVGRSDKKEREEREQLRQKLGGQITTLTLDFEDGTRVKWNVSIDKVNEVNRAVNSLGVGVDTTN